MAAGFSATAIALGALHTCAIEAGGGVKCWGRNSEGQLGIGSLEEKTSPVAVPGAGGGGGGGGGAEEWVRVEAVSGRTYQPASPALSHSRFMLRLAISLSHSLTVSLSLFSLPHL
jgi:hypothetical protein